MAIIAETLLPIFTDIDPNLKTVSIGIKTIIKKDGHIISSSIHSCAFYPGQIEKVKEFTGFEESPELTYLNTIWDQNAIDKYQQEMQDVMQKFPGAINGDQ